MKISITITICIIISLIVISGCSNRQSKRTEDNTFTAIKAEFPLRLSEIDLNDKDKEIRLNDEISTKIHTIIKEFANTISWDDRYPHTDMDVYINTICLQEKSQTVYVVLLKHFPLTDRVYSKVLFYNNQKEKFVNGTFELGLYSLYHFYDGKLNPSNLKEELNIEWPEIEIVDFNKDGTNDFQFTSLSHNGTYNGIITEIINTDKLFLDTLYFEEKSLMYIDY